MGPNGLNHLSIQEAPWAARTLQNRGRPIGRPREHLGVASLSSLPSNLDEEDGAGSGRCRRSRCFNGPTFRSEAAGVKVGFNGAERAHLSSPRRRPGRSGLYKKQCADDRRTRERAGGASWSSQPSTQLDALTMPRTAGRDQPRPRYHTRRAPTSGSSSHRSRGTCAAAFCIRRRDLARPSAPPISNRQPSPLS